MKKMSIPSRLLVALGSLAMTAAFFLPVWFIFLIAPQYPEGLTMQIWLTKLTGQVEIINGLNHYIGMKHINAAMFPEFGYMIYILGGFIVYGQIGALTGNRKLLFSLLNLSLLMAGAALYDFYQWGYDYGHNLDPKAAIKVPGLTYQPPVVGHKTLLNFDAYSYPDVGGWVILGAGAIFFLVYFFEWYKSRKAAAQGFDKSTTKKFAVAVAGIFFLSSCNTKPQPFAYGKDLCDDCRMTIIEPNFGAEIITTKGRVFKFDDVHCIVNYIKSGKIKESDINQTVFIDYNNSPAFVDGATAYLVTSEQLKSPMNSNTAAFATREAADKKAAETSGTVRDWKTVLQKQQ